MLGVHDRLCATEFMRIDLSEGRGRGNENSEKKMEMKELKSVKVLGRGAMGTVFLVQKEGSERALALKAMSKSVTAMKNDGLRRAHIEREILSKLEHPFLPTLFGHVETEKIIGWVVEYCPGGDLNALRQRQTEKMFSESIIRFYAAEIVLALEHLHSLGIVYRDLKPENILIQSNGHIMLTDFDLSTRLSPKQPTVVSETEDGLANQNSKRNSGRLASVISYIKPKSSQTQVTRSNSNRVSPVKKTRKAACVQPSNSMLSGRLNSFVGTEEYVSPEVVKGTGHEFAVDWWALGILLYEMVYGKTPFKGATRKETFYNIMVKQPQFLGPWTPLRDLILRLLDKEPEKRLGFCNGANDIKNHLFFKGLNWDAIQHVSRAPFMPQEETQMKPLMENLDIEEYLHKQSDIPKPSDNKRSSSSINIKSEDYCKQDSTPQNWVERLPKAKEVDAFGVF
eukprot:Gb_17384 [translate_table: standard]